MKQVKASLSKIKLVFSVLALVLCMIPVCASADELTGASATDVVDQMGLGFNIGNTFDATGGRLDDISSFETAWGNPVVTKELVDAIKAAGFNSVRIPTTWYRAYDPDAAEQFTISEAYMARVKEVVDYCYENDMYVILNVHHENWVNAKNLDENYEQIGIQLGRVWSQIAETFADYDQHLIFEGMNEPRKAGTDVEWSGNVEAYQAVNYLNQVFANTVRSNGKGHNAERCLMVPGYAAGSSSSILNSISLPTYNGEVVNNLIVSVHCYSPYDFCLSDKQMDFDPNNNAHTGGITGLMNTLDKLYLSNGIPVVIGETSATNKNNTEAREAWAEFMAKTSASYGVPIVIWDNGAYGAEGGECHAYFVRSKAEQNFPTVIAALVKGFNEAKWGEAVSKGSSGETGNADGTVILSEKDGKVIDAEWNSDLCRQGAEASWFAPGRDIEVTFTGGAVPNLILDSEAKAQWWMPVEYDEIVDRGGKKVAIFKYDTIKGVLDSFDVMPSELRDLCMITRDGNGETLTLYSIVATGKSTLITYKANGLDYASGSELPEDPSYTNMKFEGWYSTRDYKPGTEFTGSADSELTVFAKFSLDLAAATDTSKLPVPTPTPTKKPIEKPTKAPTQAVTGGATTGGAGSTDAPTSDSEGGLNVGIIIGIIVAALAVIGGIVAVIMKKKK